MSICHKPSQQCSTTQKWQISPWMYWRNFLPFSNIFLSDVSLLVWAHLPRCRLHPHRYLGLPSQLKDRAVTEAWAAGRFATSEAACKGTGQSISTAVESLDTVKYSRQSYIFHPVQQAVSYLSQGHRCPTPPDSSHQRRELRNSAVINNCIYPPGLIFSPPFLILCSAYQLLLFIKKTNPL